MALEEFFSKWRDWFSGNNWKEFQRRKGGSGNMICRAHFELWGRLFFFIFLFISAYLPVSPFRSGVMSSLNGPSSRALPVRIIWRVSHCRAATTLRILLWHFKDSVRKVRLKGSQNINNRTQKREKKKQNSAPLHQDEIWHSGLARLGNDWNQTGFGHNLTTWRWDVWRRLNKPVLKKRVGCLFSYFEAVAYSPNGFGVTLEPPWRVFCALKCRT